MKYLINLIQQFNRQIVQLFRNDIFSFSFVMLFVAYLLLMLPRTYGVNDNVGILFEATGGFISGFTSFFYLKLLHLLYHISNDIPWYGLTLYLVHILSLFIFIRSLVRTKNFDAFFIPVLIIYLYFYSFFITQVDYSSTSIAMGANSLFAFLVLLSNRKVSIFSTLGLALLFSLSFLIRMDGAYVVLVYGLPVIGLFFIVQYQKTQYFVIFFMPFLLLFIGDNLARTYLTSPEYQQYHEFNSLRGELHDNQILRDNQNNHKILEANNWTQDDYKNFEQWNFFDERKYNINTLSNIIKYSVSIEENKIQKYMSLYSQKLGEFIEHPGIKWSIYFLLLVSGLIIFKFYWFLVLATLCYLFYAISISIYLDIFYHFPMRIAHPIFLICVSFVILLIFHLRLPKFTIKNGVLSEKIYLWVNRSNIMYPFENVIHRLRFQFTLKYVLSDNTPNTHSLLVTMFILGVFWFLFSIGIRHNTSPDTAFKLSLNRLQSAYQGKILYIPSLVLQWEQMDPLKRYHFNFHKIVYAGGTGTFSPGFYKELEKLGVKKGYEMMPALISNPNAYIVETKTNPYCVTPDMMENDNLKCEGVIIEQLPNDRVIIKLNPR